MSSNPKRPDGPRSGSACHPYGDVGAASATFPVPATVSLPPIPPVAVSYPKMELQHLPLPSVTPVTTGTTISHPRVRPDPYLEIARPLDVRDFCNVVDWDERRRSGIESHAGSVFQNPREDFLVSHPDPEAVLTTVRLGPVHFARLPSRVGWIPTSSAGIALSRQCVSLAHRRRRTSLFETQSVGSERGDHWTHMSRFMY